MKHILGISVRLSKTFLFWGVFLCLGSSALLLVPMIARGSSPTIVEYPLPTPASNPNYIINGPGGDLWFTEATSNKVGKIDPSTGHITEYTLPTGPPQTYSWSPEGITVGPDGNLWFAEEFNYLGRMTPSGSYTQFTLPGGDYPDSVVVGPDDNLWVSCYSSDRVIVVNTSGTVLDTYSITGGPENITRGPDGNMWVAVQNADEIAKIIPSTGSIITYSMPYKVYWITVGPDGNIWYATLYSHKVGKMNPATGTYTDYTVPLPSGYTGYGPGGIGSGPDGRVWFAISYLGLGAIDPSTGTIAEYSTPSYSVGGPFNVVDGIDGNLWYTVSNNWSQIGKVVLNGSTPTPTPAAAPTPTTIQSTSPTPSHTPNPTPTPTLTPNPVHSPSPTPGPDKAKVGICHYTGSATNPYVYIVVAQSAVPAHATQGDIYGVKGAADCPTIKPPAPIAGGPTLLNSDPSYVTQTGSDQALGVGQSVDFILGSTAVDQNGVAKGNGVGRGTELHSAKVVAVGTKSVDLLVQSHPIQVHLTIGEVQAVDVTGSGQPDISVQLASIAGGHAQLIFRSLALVIAPHLATTNTEANQVLNNWQIAAIVGIFFGLVLIAVEVVLWRHKKRAQPVEPPQPGTPPPTT
jgi:streptogramin lyase